MQKRQIILWHSWYGENLRCNPEGVGENERFVGRVISATFAGLLGCSVGETVFKGNNKKSRDQSDLYVSLIAPGQVLG